MTGSTVGCTTAETGADDSRAEQVLSQALNG